MKQVILVFSIAMLCVSCSSTKKKGETGKFGRFYHNVTAKYNGYFNANEILKESFVVLEESNDDNYDQILNLYPYQPSDPKSATVELDRAIEKVSTVVSLHRPSKWVDDCYLLLGKAQFLKQDYESAEETFRFFQEEFDPYSIYSAKFEKNRKQSSSEKKKVRDEERDVKRKEIDEKKKETKEKRQEERETKADDREKRDKARKDLRKKTDKLNDEIRDIKKDLKKAEKKRKDEIRKKEKEARKKKKRLPKKDPNADPRSSKEKQLQAKLESKQAELERLKNPSEAKEEKPVIEPTEETVVQETAIEDELDAEEGSKTNKKKSTRQVPGGGLFKHKPAYYEGILWLAMTYAERGNSFSSEYLLRSLEEENVYDEIKEEIPAAYAHLYLKQKDYDKAIPALNNAIEKESSKKVKARYAFILAQIYEYKQNYSEALKYYSQVDNFKPSFLMDFHAKLKKLKLSHSTGKTSKESALKSLDKMIKEEKYADFRSQLYFAKGELEIENNNIAEAIGFFQKSLKEPGSTKQQQANVYNSLANIFYKQEKYLPSSTYYDSTLIVLDKKDERYLEVEKRARNLKDIALNIKIINEQDSLLRLSTLTREELIELAERVEQENIEKGVADASAISRPSRKPGAGNRRTGRESSSFFAYNDMALLQGQSDFRRKWGDRALEDNWRRSNRTNASETTDVEVVVDEPKKDMSDEQVRKILGDIPFSPKQKTSANNKIADAMYDLGVKYRDNLDNYEKSTETLEELLRRYPNFEKRLDAYYYLYLSYNDLNQRSKANGYASKITSEFPESDYAKIISDPAYLDELIADGGSLERIYKEVYSLFENEKYAQAKARIDLSKNELELSNPYAAKFGLLSAMCIGSLEGKDAYVKALRDVTTRYPNAPEKTRAQEILRFLRGEGDAFSDLIYEEEKDVFKDEEEKLHYNILVVYDVDNNKMNDLKVALSDYNKKYHKQDKLKVASIFLNREDDSQIVLIRRFKNKSKAMQYYVSAITKADELTKGLDIDYTMYSVTQRNYREIIKQKSEKAYRAFYEKYYLNQ